MLGLAYKREVARLGISVGVCHPSWIDTNIVRNAEKDLPAFRAIRSRLPIRPTAPRASRTASR